MADENPKSPEKTIRLGNVSASVFANQSESGREFRSVVFQRSYRDGDETKYSHSFNAADLAVLDRVLKLAQQHVEELEAVVRDAKET